MAFHTLDELRTLGLNTELGLTADADATFGTTAQRNGFITRALAKLWPSMGRLRRENVTITLDVQDYTLTTVWDVERVEVMSLTTTTLVDDKIRSWSAWLDEAADPAVCTIHVQRMQTARILRVTGYTPYKSEFASGSTASDIPARLEHVVMSGARVEAFRWMMTRYANYEGFNNENRANSLSPADVIELLRQAKTEFDKGMKENARNLTGAHRAQYQTD